MQLTSLLASTAQQTRELPVSPVAYGVIAFGILLALLLLVLMFGKGRPHS